MSLHFKHTEGLQEDSDLDLYLVESVLPRAWWEITPGHCRKARGGAGGCPGGRGKERSCTGVSLHSLALLGPWMHECTFPSMGHKGERALFSF